MEKCVRIPIISKEICIYLGIQKNFSRAKMRGEGKFRTWMKGLCLISIKTRLLSPIKARKGQKKSWLWIDKLDYLENLRLKVFFELASDICACSLNSRAKFTLLSWTLHCDLFFNSHSKNNHSQKMLSKKGIGNRDGSKIVKMDRYKQNLQENWVSKQSFFVLILTTA